eukprot:PhF_6_TR972/c0_g1_i10/m.1867
MRADSMNQTNANDVWALGVTMYCVLFGVLPHPAGSYMEYCDKVKNTPIQFPVHLHPQVPRVLFDLLHRMLWDEPGLRPTMREIAQHPFFLPRPAAAPLPFPRGCSSSISLFWAVRMRKKKNSENDKKCERNEYLMSLAQCEEYSNLGRTN